MLKQRGLDKGVSVITGFLVVCATLYFLPAVIAAIRGVNRLGSVFVLNLLLGWTLIGWVAALVMAMSMETSGEYELRIRSYSATASYQQPLSFRSADFLRSAKESKGNLPLISLPALILVFVLAFSFWPKSNDNMDMLSVSSVIPSQDMSEKYLKDVYFSYYRDCRTIPESSSTDRSCHRADMAAYLLQTKYHLCWGPNYEGEAAKDFMACGQNADSLVPDDFHL